MRTVPAATTGPVTVTADSRLTDDYLLVSAASVAADALSPMCVAASADGTTLYYFAILSEGASELQPGSTGAAGFTAAPLPGGANATEVVGFVDSYDSSVHACYITPDLGLVHVSRPAAGPWPAVPAQATADQVSSLAVASIAATAQTAVTAVYSTGDLMLLTADGSDNWTANTVSANGALSGYQVRLTYTSPNNWTLFAANSSSPLQVWYGASGDGSNEIQSGPMSVTVAADVAKVWFAYSHGPSPMVIFSDVNGALYSSADFVDNVVQSVQLSNVTNGSATVDAAGNIHFFGADPDGTLWVLHQTAWDDLGAPVWAPIFPLDTDVSYVAAVSGVITASAVTMALGAVRIGGDIDLVTQPGTAGEWSRTPVQVPSLATPPVALQTNRYRTRLTLSNANGLPAAGLQVSVTPSDLVAFEVAGACVVAAPGAGVLLTADATGCVEFSQVATGLEAVTFSVTGPGIGAPVTVAPHQYLHDQLAGTASIFTGSTTIPAMNATTLQQATSGGGPVFPGITSAQATAVASASQAIFSVLNGSVTQNVVGYSLDLTASPPSFTPLYSADELAASQAAAASAAGGFWDDIGQFFDDVWHGIEQGALTVAQWTIDVVHQSISLTVSIGDKVSAVLEGLVFNTVTAAISLVHSLFNWLGAAVATVLDWLKDLLPWDQIWSAMQTFNSYLINGLQGLTNFLEYKAVIASGTFFKDLQGQVDEAIEQAIAQLGDQPLRPDRGPQPLTKPFSQPPGWLPGSDVTNNWVTSKLTTYLPQSEYLSAGGLTEVVVNQVIGAIQSSGLESDISEEVAAVQSFLATVWSSQDLMGDASAASALTVIKGLIDCVLGLLDALVTIVLELIGDAITVLVTMFSTPLPTVPLLTWLWDNVMQPAGSDVPMTLGNLICLAIATPVTLMTELANLGDPQAIAVGAGDALAGVRAGVSAVLTVVDMANDSINAFSEETTPPGLVVNAVDFAANAVTQMAFWPVGIPLWNWDWDFSSMTKGDRITNAVWIGTFVLIGVDGFFTAIDTLAYLLGWGETFATISQNANVALDTALGAAVTGLGLWGAIEQFIAHPPDADALDILEAFVGPLPWVTQACILPGVVEASDGCSWLAQMFIDFMGDWDWSDWAAFFDATGTPSA